MGKIFSGKGKWIVIVLVLAILGGAAYWIWGVPKDNGVDEMDELEIFISEIGVNFISHDFVALGEQFAPDAVFAHEGNEYTYEEGLQRLIDNMDLLTEMEVGLTVVNGRDDTTMKCTATGKLVYDTNKILAEYRFELVKERGSYWKISRMESPRSRWFNAAFLDEE